MLYCLCSQKRIVKLSFCFMCEKVPTRHHETLAVGHPDFYNKQTNRQRGKVQGAKTGFGFQHIILSRELKKFPKDTDVYGMMTHSVQMLYKYSH